MSRFRRNRLPYILAAELVASNIEGPYEITASYAGSELEGMEYEPLYSFKEPEGKAYYVTCDGYVTTSDGTGIVHIAPAFGADDAQVGRKYGCHSYSWWTTKEK